MDCSIILNHLDSHDSNNGLAAACIQAIAAVRAAKIGAKSTTNAGWLTLVGAIAAITAAVIAYYAAGRQTRLAERMHHSRAIAYANLIGEELKGLEIDMHIAKDGLDQWRTEKDNGATKEQLDIIWSNHLFMAPSVYIRPEQWESHALLGTRAAKEIANTFRRSEIARSSLINLRGSPDHSVGELNIIFTYLDIVDQKASRAMRYINEDLMLDGNRGLTKRDSFMTTLPKIWQRIVRFLSRSS